MQGGKGQGASHQGKGDASVQRARLQGRRGGRVRESCTDYRETGQQGDSAEGRGWHG